MIANRISEWDLSGCLYLNRHCEKTAVNQFFAVISRLGDGVFWYSLGAVLPLIYGIQGFYVTGVFTIVGLSCLALYKALKRKFYRARPFVRSKQVIKGCAPLDVCSFPSGHTMHACAFTTVIAWYFPEFLFLLLPFTLLIGASRMVLGLHYPSDVIIGAVLGVCIAVSGVNGFDYLAAALGVNFL